MGIQNGSPTQCFFAALSSGTSLPWPPTVYAIMTGSDMDMAFRLLTSTGGYKKTLFMLDTSYEHFYFLPNNSYGEYLSPFIGTTPAYDAAQSATTVRLFFPSVRICQLNMME